MESSKISLVDLTGRRLTPSLANDGSRGEYRGRTSTSTTTAATTVAGPVTLGSDVAVDAQVCRGTIGLGGDDPQSSRCDWEALGGRMGREETCIVNAAIMKSRYPHVGGKQFNKPIVVDLDLPVWEE
jgi:hypothetical protein|uniref:Uncharacterized protein n=1 Tax=Bionectria ochroleuca TaxID=29856 RepID=A0A8H7KDX8_BIOOC